MPKNVDISFFLYTICFQTLTNYPSSHPHKKPEQMLFIHPSGFLSAISGTLTISYLSVFNNTCTSFYSCKICSYIVAAHHNTTVSHMPNDTFARSFDQSKKHLKMSTDKFSLMQMICKIPKCERYKEKFNPHIRILQR